MGPSKRIIIALAISFSMIAQHQFQWYLITGVSEVIGGPYGSRATCEKFLKIYQRNGFNNLRCQGRWNVAN